MPLQYFVGYEPTGDEETGPDGGQEFDGKVWCVDTDARGPEGDIDPDVSVLFHVNREQDAKDIVALLEARDVLLSALRKARVWVGGMSFTPACLGEAEKLLAEMEAAISSAEGRP